MAKFHGPVGYQIAPVETAPGVWEDVVAEYPYYGDVLRNTRTLDDEGSKPNNDITIGVNISILADSFAHENIKAIRYVKYSGSLWTVRAVDVERPRLILRLGGVYNGPTPRSPDAP